MDSAANVRSSEAIEALRTALIQFGAQVEEGLTEVESETRRVLDWLEHDRPRYWKERVRDAWDDVGRAKAELHRCLMYPIGVQERPSCFEERAALKKAQARLAYCEEKVERLRHWIREVRHELFEYEGRIAAVNESLELQIPHSIAVLSRVLDRIAGYAELRVETTAQSAKLGPEAHEARESFKRDAANHEQADDSSSSQEMDAPSGEN